MKVLGAGKILNFSQRHREAKSALEAWLIEVKQSQWCTTHDIKERYRSADFLSDNRVVFNIKGNHNRLVVKVRYQHEMVVVIWIGTHAEYDKITF